ncbi:MAG: aminotransferase class I/II-fold pyridoxal phosphate-dependent enzyme [Rhodospirillaceae bacterium]|nr:aminotransferase class I/II-fold pyridoxal phosphate-dependent enzyme [Rhodospirillaceae bacterium]
MDYAPSASGRSKKPLLGGPIGARARLDGREVIVLGSNDYLGLANHPAVIARAQEALARYGAGPALNPPLATTPIHEALCDALARFHGTESALLFNSCTSANVAVACTLVGDGDRIFSDRLNHASIIDGCRLSAAQSIVYAHGDFAELDARLGEDDRRALVVSDGVFSMEGDAVDLPRLIEVCRRRGATLAVDESHAAGVIGPGGRGTAALRGCTGQVDLYTGTLSKAFGAFAGGYVAASAATVATLHDRGRFFMFTTAVAPAAAAGALAAVEIVLRDDSLVRRLAANTQRLRQGLGALGFRLLGGDSPITPVMIGDEEKARLCSQALMEAGVYVGAVRFPVVPRGEARLRAQPSAAHSEADIDEAVAAFGRVGRHLGLI